MDDVKDSAVSQFNNAVRVLNDCCELMSKTKNEETFFSRYGLALEKLDVIKQCVDYNVIREAEYKQLRYKILNCYKYRRSDFNKDKITEPTPEWIDKEVSYVIRSIRYGSYPHKKIPVTENEKIFIESLIRMMVYQNLYDSEGLKLERLADCAFNVHCKTCYMGKVRLQKRKTYIQVLKGEDDILWYENRTVDEYIKHIEDWISYIKYCRQGRICDEY